MGKIIGRLRKGFDRAKEIREDLKTKSEQRDSRRQLAKEEAMRKVEAKAERQIKFTQAKTKQLTAQAKLYETAERARKAKSKFRKTPAINVKPALDYASDFLRVTPPKKTKKKKGIPGWDYL